MEYCDSKLLSLLSVNGRLSEFSCLGTSQQNRRAERKHMHILDSVWAMHIYSSFPARFLGEARLGTVFTINRIRSSVHGNMSPYECLYNIACNYTLFKVFSTCFVLLQPHGHKN